MSERSEKLKKLPGSFITILALVHQPSGFPYNEITTVALFYGLFRFGGNNNLG